MPGRPAGRRRAVTRILGIDPGLRVTGFGLIEAGVRKAAYISSGCIRSEGGDLSQRLRVIFEGVQALIREHRPDEAAIENVFVQRNASSALKLGQARGAAICAIVIESVPVYEYTPAQVKQSIAGRGGAAKQQVRHMVCALLGLRSPPRMDASDALACALSHYHVRQTRARLMRRPAHGLAP
jgi:crossover junction endodeoxyribonuclease RuvC